MNCDAWNGLHRNGTERNWNRAQPEVRLAIATT